MKKRIAIILCIILVTSLLTACAGASENAAAPMDPPSQSGSTGMANNVTAPMAPPPPSESPVMEVMDDSDYYGEYDDALSSSHGTGSSTGGSSVIGITAPVIEGFAEKIIYSVTADIETINFDETIARVSAMIAANSAFIESSSISGQSYNSQRGGWIDYRFAQFTIRVPKENLDAMTGYLDNLGYVTQFNSNATNITSQFIDTQARVNSLVLEEERLLDMLSNADDISYLIILEERLSNIRYQIESITSTLKNWQTQVDFSTLTLQIREVEQYTEREEIQRSYWQQIGDGFMSTMSGVGRFFMGLFKWLIIAAPVLVILAVIAIVIIIIVRKSLKSMAKKNANKPKPPPYQYPPVHGQSYAAPPIGQSYAAPPKEPPSQENENQ